MNRNGWLTLLALLAAVLALAPLTPSGRPGSGKRTIPRIPASIGGEEDAQGRDEMEFEMTRDPRTNSIPRDIYRRERAMALTLPRRGPAGHPTDLDRAMRVAVPTWTERGPNNVGGRTRTFAIDVTNASKLIAGGVGGGIWRSLDDGASWSAVTTPGQMHSSTCIAQDRRGGHTNTWYVGTGEIRGSTTNDTRWGSLYRGDGIYKSTDGGTMWSLLPSTVSGTPQTSNNFDWVINVATNPANAGQDEVFAATWNGIYRSTDGGTTWFLSLASDSGFTDVAVTSTGVSYAITRTAGVIHVWRSPDGTTWTEIKPGTFPVSANRIVFGLAPSNVNVVYLLVQGVAGINGHQFWKYTYVSGNGSGAGGTWSDRTVNIPDNPQFPNDAPLNTQLGYDQVCHVKPDNENFVIIGGTNLYRSTDGFASTANSSVIGGYSFYPNLGHHPDLHAGGFSPANANVYYSAGDGGISKAADITLANMVWTSLDHGYNVTQLYSVAIAPESGSNLLLGGAQDNGSWLGTSPGASNWTMAYGGDGTVVAIAPIADNTIYTQWQNGNIQRLPRDLSTSVDFSPTGVSNPAFVNPIVLDPNDSHLLYYGGGTTAAPGTTGIWRNDNAPIATNTTGWTHLATTDLPAASGYTRYMTAIGISTVNNPNVLYYGTNDGMVMRADNANTAAPTVTNVTPPGLAGGQRWGGFVRCISVDPTDANRALVVFGNYNFQSLWYTHDGGVNWDDVEGNLAGPSGPSIRWATTFYIGSERYVFLGTSIGVLSSDLNSNPFVWSSEASEIGNTLIAYMAYRPSDHTLAVATHGRGIWTTQLTTVGVGGPRPRPGVALRSAVPNPSLGRTATIAYELPEAMEATLRLYDVSGRQVASLAEGRQGAGRHQVTIAPARFPPGVYYDVLNAGGATRTGKVVLGR